MIASDFSSSFLPPECPLPIVLSSFMELLNVPSLLLHDIINSTWHSPRNIKANYHHAIFTVFLITLQQTSFPVFKDVAKCEWKVL